MNNCPECFVGLVVCDETDNTKYCSSCGASVHSDLLYLENNFTFDEGVHQKLKKSVKLLDVHRASLTDSAASCSPRSFFVSASQEPVVPRVDYNLHILRYFLAIHLAFAGCVADAYNLQKARFLKSVRVFFFGLLQTWRRNGWTVRYKNTVYIPRRSLPPEDYNEAILLHVNGPHLDFAVASRQAIVARLSAQKDLPKCNFAFLSYFRKTPLRDKLARLHNKNGADFARLTKELNYRVLCRKKLSFPVASLSYTQVFLNVLLLLKRFIRQGHTRSVFRLFCRFSADLARLFRAGHTNNVANLMDPTAVDLTLFATPTTVLALNEQQKKFLSFFVFMNNAFVLSKTDFVWNTVKQKVLHESLLDVVAVDLHVGTKSVCPAAAVEKQPTNPLLIAERLGLLPATVKKLLASQNADFSESPISSFSARTLASVFQSYSVFATTEQPFAEFVLQLANCSADALSVLPPSLLIVVEVCQVPSLNKVRCGVRCLADLFTMLAIKHKLCVAEETTDCALFHSAQKHFPSSEVLLPFNWKRIANTQDVTHSAFVVDPTTQTLFNFQHNESAKLQSDPRSVLWTNRPTQTLADFAKDFLHVKHTITKQLKKNSEEVNKETLAILTTRLLAKSSGLSNLKATTVVAFLYDLA